MTIAEEKDGNACSTQLPFFINFFLTNCAFFERIVSAVIVPIFGAICQLSRRGSASSAGSLKPWNHSADTEPQARGTKYSSTVASVIYRHPPPGVCARTTKCLKNTNLPSWTHLNTHPVKMCQMSPEFCFLTLPSGECGPISLLPGNYGLE